MNRPTRGAEDDREGERLYIGRAIYTIAKMKFAEGSWHPEAMTKQTISVQPGPTAHECRVGPCPAREHRAIVVGEDGEATVIR